MTQDAPRYGRQVPREERERSQYRLRALVEFHALFNQDAAINDRAIAILGATLPDILLEHLLTEFFVEDAKEVAALLKPERPLGAFGARIATAYCLGLICKTVRDDLRRVAEIRNKFAHRLDAAFEEEPIRSLCHALKWHEFGMMRKAPERATARDVFQVGVNQLIAYLNGRPDFVRHERRTIATEDEGGPTLLR